MKVLFLGHCSFYTVSNLATSIKKNIPDVSISAADLVKPGGGKITAEELKRFDEAINLPRKRNIRFKFRDEVREALNILKDKRKKIFLKYLVYLKVNSLRNYIKSETEEKIYSEKISDALKKYDVLHFHYIVPEYLNPLKYAGKKKKIIFTYWGSDLFQLKDEETRRKIYEALKKADYITINTPEMRDFFINKFGKEFIPKIRTAYFILNEAKFENINRKNNPETLKNFKVRHNISPEKKVIVVGYNGSSKQRHIEVLNILSELEDEFKKRIHIVIPLSYGLEFEAKDYPDKVKEAAEKSGMENTIFTEYLENNELFEFIIGSDIKLNLRDTDSMNASMIESLAAGNIVVNGAWLPYGKLESLGIKYRKIKKLEDLKKVIPEILQNYDEEKVRVQCNYKIIREFFSEENLIKGWKNLYEEIKTGIENT